MKEFGADNARTIIAIGRTIAFIMGSAFSLMVGQLGMRMAIQANVRVAAASRRGFNEALSIAYYAGTITGMLTDGLGLMGGTLIFIIFGTAAPDVLLGFGFGGTLLALFMRVGGGIYTKAADVGADLVGKVEKDIPEDDPRNAAVIADLVGDNVGDCAGMAADIFESYEVTIVSALILGLSLVSVDPSHSLKWIVYPLIIRGIGVISSIIGTFTVPIWEKIPVKFLRAHDAEESMFRSYEVSSVNHCCHFLLCGYPVCPGLASGCVDRHWCWSGCCFQPVDLLLHFHQEVPGQGNRQINKNRSCNNHPFWSFNWYGIQRLGSFDHCRFLHFWSGIVFMLMVPFMFCTELP